MPRVGAIKRRDLITYLRQLGFQGPYAGPDYSFMLRDHLRLKIPNRHEGDISEELLRIILRQAGIDRATWENLR